MSFVFNYEKGYFSYLNITRVLGFYRLTSHLYLNFIHVKYVSHFNYVRILIDCASYLFVVINFISCLVVYCIVN